MPEHGVLQVKVAWAGVDEKAFRKGHKYMTVVCDLERTTVEYVAEDWKADSHTGFWKNLSKKQLKGIKAVPMDKKYFHDKRSKNTGAGIPRIWSSQMPPACFFLTDSNVFVIENQFS